MNMRFFATTAAAAVLLAAPASAATFTLDDFNTAQLATADPSTTVVNNGGEYAAAGRDFTVDATVAENAGSNLTNSTRLESFGGLLSFSTTASVRGSAEVTYRDLNLMNSRETGFFTFNVVPDTFDGDAVFSVFGIDGDNNQISYSENLIGAFSPILRFNEFDFLSGTFDFFNVASLSFKIDSTTTRGNVDGQLDSITVSAVPVPAAGLLLLGALGGVAALNRRRAAKKAA